MAAFKKELTQLREVLMAAKEEVAAMEKERDEVCVWACSACTPCLR